MPNIKLTSLKLPVSLEVTEGCLEISGVKFTVSEWRDWHQRVERLLRRANLIPRPQRGAQSLGSHPFLLNNTREIAHRRRGHIKRAPWFLRPFFDGVVTKTRYEDN